MRTLALLSLAAAAAAIPTAASAQPRAGHSWSGQQGRNVERVVVRRGPGAIAGAPGMRRDFRQFRRIGRGQILPTFWAAPQFHVQQWQSYGFPQPQPGYRWVRYYDDALLVDRGGRVHDSRSDYDWDRYGDRWSRDESGIPMYVGDGDYRPDGRDYRWAEESDEGGWDYSEYGDAEHRGTSCGGERRGGPCGGPGHGGGHGSGHGGGHGQGGYSSGHSSSGGYSSGGYSSGGYSNGYSGYGYGYGGATVTITETVVEGGGAQVIEETVYEEVIETRARARRAAPRRPAPVRRPIRGERG